VIDGLVLCTYRVRADSEDAFRGWLTRHWPTLHDLEFVTDDPATHYRYADEPTYVEMFTWRDGGVVAAHADPRLQELWAEVEPWLEDRNGRPKWEFPHLVSVGSEP
jgi:hypothetical protein